MTLEPADIEAIAQRTAELIGAADDARWLTVRSVAELLGVGTDFVYEHQVALGARRLTDSKRAPLRFRRDLVLAGIDRLSQPVETPPPARRGRPRKRATRVPGELLGGMKARPQ